MPKFASTPLKPHRISARLLARLLVALLTFACLLAWPGSGQAGKLEIAAGYFDFTASSSGRTGHASGAGFYHLGYRAGLTDHFEVDLGYSLVATKIYTGDLEYGPDIGFNWFPVTGLAPRAFESAHVRGSVVELWRPYIGVFFAQRSFRSVQSSYAGFGGKLGIERSLNPRLSGRAEARYAVLSGSTGASANELHLSLGLVVHFE